MTFKCCIEGCKTVSKNGLHSFPTNEEIATKWIELSGSKRQEDMRERMQMNKLSHSYFKICEKHFKENDFVTNQNGQRHLLKGVLPSLYLSDELLRIQKEHDYGSVKGPRSKRQKISDVNANDEYTNNDGTDTVFDADVNIFDNYLNEVGANTEVDSIESLDALHQIKTDKDRMAASLKYYKARCEQLTQQLKENKLNDENVTKYVSTKFNKQQLEFFKMQLDNSGKAPNGRRYNNDQKNLTLAMYKQSPKHYRFMKRMFILPGKSSLARHSAHLLFTSGIDVKLMECIKNKVKTMSEIDKYCMISWDEMALKAHLEYSPTRDVIDGFVELDEVRHPRFATHSLTFMIRGINTSYKQPITFYYTDNLNALELAGLVRKTIEAVFETGLKVVGSVCDQIPTNVSTVHHLIDPSCGKKSPNGELLEYKISGNRIIHIYDAPHLLKVLRNNMEIKDLRHFVSKQWEFSDGIDNSMQQPKYASWSHLIDLYKLDCRASHRMLPKLSDEHLKPEKEKMKVSNATQIFSKTVGEVMLNCTKNQQLPKHFDDTAYILLFFNNLFDSINGDAIPRSDTLKGSINQDSIHFVFWEYALSELSKMNFIDTITGELNNGSSVLKKFESSIRGHIELARICLNLNMSKVSLRNMNQDGLENLFGGLKTLSQNGKKLIASQYRTSYTTAILNNLSGPNSLGSNCEDDKSIALLNDISEFLLDYNKPIESDDDENYFEMEEEIFEKLVLEPLFEIKELNFVETESVSTSSAKVCRKLLQSTDCDECKQTLLVSSAQLYNDESIDITLPSQMFIDQFKNVFCCISNMIPQLCSEVSVSKKLVSSVEKVNVNVGCVEHDSEIALKMKKCTANYALMQFCNDINSLLSGKISSLPPDFNKIQEQAFIFHKKGKKIGKYSDKFQL